ncbi:MAG: A1S_2505 family phage non-structural protein [Methylococcaceae bacterium]
MKSYEGVWIGRRSPFNNPYKPRTGIETPNSLLVYQAYIYRQAKSHAGFRRALVRLHAYGIQYGELKLRCQCRVGALCHRTVLQDYLNQQSELLDEWLDLYQKDWVYYGKPEHLNSSYDRESKKPVYLPNGDALNSVYVFGSNTAGLHGKGAALEGLIWHGAKMGLGEGASGLSYAIPTKDAQLRPLRLGTIARSIDDFLHWKEQDQKICYVTAAGCGLAGYRTHDIAPLFNGLRDSWVPQEWYSYLL